MKNNEIYLQDLVHSLKHAHVKLDLEFLNKLLQNASKCEKPWRNKEFAQEICCLTPGKPHSISSIYVWIKGKRTIPMSKLIKIVNLSDYNLLDIEKKLISIKAGAHKGEIKPKFPIKIGHQLGSIVGHILGDGAIDKRGHTVFYSNSNPELLSEFIHFMEEIVGAKPRIWVQKKRLFNEKTEWLRRVKNVRDVPKKHSVGLFYPKICCDILHSLFGKFADGKKKQITSQIKKAPSDFKKGLIRAFFDDEGSIRSQDHLMKFHQDNKQMLKDLKLILQELGINTNPIRTYIKGNKERCYFSLTGFNEYCRFHYLIGCTSSKKRIEFELLIKKVTNSRKMKNKVR